MGVILPTAKSPWGVSLDAQRADLWEIDLAKAVGKMVRTLISNGAAPDWINVVNEHNLKFTARSVAFPSRQLATNPIRLNNTIGNFPGYSQPSGVMSIVFLHENDPTDDRNACWLALEIWRAFSRAGQGFSFVNQGKSQLNLSLLDASSSTTGQYGLIPDYVHDVTVTLLRGPSMAEGYSANSEYGPEYSLVTGAKYIVRQAWLSEFQLGEISYEAGTKLLEIKASFSINDYHLDATRNGLPVTSTVFNPVTAGSFA